MCCRCFVAALWLLVATVGCDGPGRALVSQSAPGWSEAAAPQVSLEAIAEAIEHAIGRKGPDGSSTEPRAELTALYGPGEYAPLWVDARGAPTSAAFDALAVLQDAGTDGLQPATYRAAHFADLARALRRSAPVSVPEAAAFDAGLSRAMLEYWHDLHAGRVDPRTLGFERLPAAAPPDYGALLHAALADGRLAETTEELRPALGQYRALRQALVRYRALAANPALDALRLPERTVHPGEPLPSAAALARLLGALGDLPAGEADQPRSGGAPVFDRVLVEGVQRFQVRHGLEPDGVIGAATRAALAVPLGRRARQIELTLERLRWFPERAATRIVLVNIPMFRLWAWDVPVPDGPPAFSTKVIVGRALRTETPVFTAEMRYVIFRPYWNVPLSIARGEILPAVRRDPAYLREHDMEIVFGQSDEAQPMPATPENLARVANGLLRIRQRPGPNNALGLIKFMFPNEQNVYLHGTPAMELFARPRRDFSHGCVRVEQPVALAEWALGDPGLWPREAIVSAMQDSRSRRVDLTRPVQVVLFYATAWVLPDGNTIHFAEDIYQRDARLDAALYSGS